MGHTRAGRREHDEVCASERKEVASSVVASVANVCVRVMELHAEISDCVIFAREQVSRARRAGFKPCAGVVLGLSVGASWTRIGI